MSASTDEENSTTTMISAKYRVDITLGTDGDSEGKTLLCAHRNSPTSVNYAIGKGKNLLICDGNSEVADIKQRFTLEFDIKKIMYHTVKSSRNLEKKLKIHGKKHADIPLWKEETVQEREYLIVCGEHRILFIAVVDYHFYHYEIPFKLRNVFAISNGILVERFYDASNEQSFHYHDTFHLYSLSGPFGELLPVIYKTIGYQPHWKFCWQSHEDDAEMVGSDRNFVVVFDEKEKNHRIYMARETEEKEVQSAIRYVETQRKHFHESMMFSNSNNQCSTRTPRQITAIASAPNVRSPAMIALSEVINSEIEIRSPHQTHSRPGFGHSTPNNANGQYPGTLPTPIFEGASDSKIWASTPAATATPRINTRVNAKNLERNIHTRSLARMAQTDDNQCSIPGPSTQTSAHSPFNQGQPMNPFCSTQFGTPKMPNQRWKRASGNAELLREFTRMIRFTPRKSTKVMGSSENDEESHMGFGELERDPDLDLLLSKICLECVYVEPKQIAISRADKVFLSHCLTQFYLNLMTNESRKIKVISVWNSCEKTKKELAENANDKYVVIECKDAAVLEKSGLTVVMESDNSVALYGGMDKISLIYINHQAPPFSNDIRLHSFVGNVFAAMNNQTLIRVELPPACECESIHDLLRTVFLNLPINFAQSLLRSWRSIPNVVHDQKYFRSVEIQELHHVVLFLLRNVGVNVTDLKMRNDTQSPEVGAKHMKPRRTIGELFARLTEYIDECDGQCPMNKSEDDASKFANQFMISVDVIPANVFIRQLFFALHAQFEEWTLDTFMHHLLPHLVGYLHIIGTLLGETRFLNYYKSSYYSMFKESSFIFSNTFDSECAEPSAPLETLNLIGNIYSTSVVMSSCADVCRVATKRCLRILTVVAAGSSLLNSISLDCGLWLGKDFVKRLGLNSEMRKGFFQILQSQGDDSAKANSLLRLFNIDASQIANMTMGLRILLLKYQAEAYAGMRSLEPKECIYATDDENTSIWNYRFPHDIRIRNIEVMLDSSKPVLVATNIIQSTQDATIKEKQDRFLQQTSLRYFSQAFGRALFHFRSEVPSLLQPLDFPQLAMGGSLYPARVTCDPPNNEIYKLHLEWAEFYNSVSAALRVGSSDMVKIDNEWMLMTSKAGKSAAAVAGLTLGFGLNGHLDTLNMYHAHQMLAAFDRFHSVALLIGLSASKFKSCDVQVYKILATYLPFLMGPTMLEIKLDCTVQTAAISALGLLFADSGNMNIAKKLVNEIGRSPNTEDEPLSDRFAYKLSAGFSLGLIMLGKGNGASVTSLPFKQKIPPLSERLICIMNGGLKSRCVFMPHTAAPAPPEVSTLPFGPPGGGPGHSANQIPNHVQDSNHINIHLSSQPAIIALGFMFMKTGDEFIASNLALPESISDLEKIRPDFIFTRILSYCLIMWDKIDIDDEFVNDLVPPKVMEFMAVGLKYGGDPEVYEMRDDENEYWDEIVDRHTLAQTYLLTIAGACTAIALKYCCAGGPPDRSASKRAFQLLEHFISIVIPDGEIEKKIGHRRVCEFAGPATVSLVFSSLIMAMGIVNVGLGDKYTMRYARLLRISEKLEKDVWANNSMKHHEQILAHTTLGMLLMGGGRYAFKKDNLSIALIIISILPVVSQNVADNAHYHQPLRFLWSLAAEPRLIVPYDPSESAVIECDCTIHLKEPYDWTNKTYTIKAPCIIPPIQDIESIEVGGGQYELVRISLNTEEDRKLMVEILSIGQGRIKLKKFGKPLDEANNPNQDEFEPDVYTQVLDIEKMFNSPDSALICSEQEFDSTQHDLDDILRLNKADKYPQVQMHLNSFKEAINRTTDEMTSLQISNVDLAQKIVEGWPNEVHLAQKLHEIIDALPPSP